MTQELYEQVETILKKLEQLYKFASKYDEYPVKKVIEIKTELQELQQQIPTITEPQNIEETMQAELQRNIEKRIFTINDWLSGGKTDFETIKKIYGIQEEDLQNLRPWLKEHKEKVLQAIENLSEQIEINNFELELPIDIPQVKRQAEEYAAVHIQKYHKNLGKMLQELTKAGEFLRDIEAVPTKQNRSYFFTLTKTLAIEIPGICKMKEDGTIQINERELIRIYGHEGMGHALNEVITNASNLPYFLKTSLFATQTTMESIAQFYERRIFEDIKERPEVQKALGIDHKFNEIYEEMQARDLLTEYKRRLDQYAITVLADKELGKHDDLKVIQKRIELISEVALNPIYAKLIVFGNSRNYDPEGNFEVGTAKELVYSSQAVKRALKEFEKQGIKYEGKNRSVIDMALLEGFWTPEGLVERAKVTAKKYKNQII